MVDKKSPVPLYIQLRDTLREAIGAGEYPAGSQLPTEFELARRYGLGRATVRSALALLGRLGFSKTLNAKGTIALLPEKPAALRALQAETDPRDLMLYLFSLQFMALVIRPAALLAAAADRALAAGRDGGLLAAVPVKGAPPLGPFFDAGYRLAALRPMLRLCACFIFALAPQGETTYNKEDPAALRCPLSETKRLGRYLEEGWRGVALSPGGELLLAR